MFNKMSHHFFVVTVLLHEYFYKMIVMKLNPSEILLFKKYRRQSKNNNFRFFKLVWRIAFHIRRLTINTTLKTVLFGKHKPT